MTRFLMTILTIAALVPAVYVQPAYAGDRSAQPAARDAAGRSNDTDLDEKWEKMSPEERREMMKNYERWKSLPAEKRESIKKGYAYYERLTPEGKAEFRIKMERYRRYSSEHKVQLKKRLKTWRDLDPQQQKIYFDTVERFRQLPQSKQDEIRSRINAIKKLPPDRQVVEKKALVEELKKEGVLLPVTEMDTPGQSGGNEGRGRGNPAGRQDQQHPTNWKR